MMGFLLVFVGAGLGGMARHGVGIAALRLGSGFPYGASSSTSSGSILMGLFTGWFAMRGGPQALRLFIATGILGGFATFSSTRSRRCCCWSGARPARHWPILGSVVLGLAGLFLGLPA